MPLKLKEGDKFPAARLTDHTGEEVSLLDLTEGLPLILTLYRGYW